MSDDSYVQRQKEDIQELTSMFRGMLDNNGADGEEEYLSEFKKAFVPQPGFEAIYTIIIEENESTYVDCSEWDLCGMRLRRNRKTRC